MTVAADKGALAELVESILAMKGLWLIFGILIAIIITYITYKMLEKR